MAIGERIRFIRNLRGMTQKYLGMAVGFPERAADVRMAQYESGTRTPKADLTKTLAHALDVSPAALEVPDIDTEIGLMHTFFAMEDLYAIKIGEINGEVCLQLDKTDFNKWHSMLERFRPGWKKSSGWSAARSPKKNTISGAIPIPVSRLHEQKLRLMHYAKNRKKQKTNSHNHRLSRWLDLAL